MTGAKRFIGLTKTQFGIIIAILVVLVLGAQTYSVYENYRLAEQGKEAHASLCVFKRDLAGRAADSRAFLALTHKERVAKYGHALGDIPTATIMASLHNQEATVRSLAKLNCD